jgi:hypothetical protein
VNRLSFWDKLFEKTMGEAMIDMSDKEVKREE